MEIILASNSPRRKKILSELGYKFTVIPSGIDEENKKNLSPNQYVIDVCERKALFVLGEGTSSNQALGIGLEHI